MFESFLNWLNSRQPKDTRRTSSARLVLEELETRLALNAPTITVNSNLDDNVRNAVLTFREAIMIANGDLAKNALTMQEKAQVEGDPTAASLDIIQFNIANGITIIKPTNAPLPTIYNPVEIDGTAPMGKANQVIVLDGTDAGATANGLKLTKMGMMSASGSTIKGLVIQNFKGNGIELNNVGTSTIGGTKDSDRNIITGNKFQDKAAGILITGTEAVGNYIINNYIGNDGTNKKPNDYGIKIEDGASSNKIGDADITHRNVISGNERTGIRIIDASSNVIDGNYIGTDKTGKIALANTDGIIIFNGSDNSIGSPRTLVKEALEDPANIISGNIIAGIWITGASNRNTIQGNYIGVDQTGEKKLMNGNDGIFLSGTTDKTLIGGDSLRAVNVISGNGNGGDQKGNGIRVSDGVKGTVIQFNNIGIGKDRANVKLELGNHLNGIYLKDATDTVLIKKNEIRHNRIGAILDPNKKQKTVDPNQSFNNGGIGIDVGDPGRSLGESPTITLAERIGNTVHIQGNLQNVPDATFILEFFGNLVEDPDDAEGEFYLGTAQVQTDSNGYASFDVIFNAVYGNYVTATFTNTAADGYTSEFSQAVELDGGAEGNALVGDWVFADTNRNGIQDAGETGFANVTVNLVTAAGSLFATTTSATDGSYVFDNVTPGDYYLEWVAPAGYRFSPSYHEDFPFDSDADRADGRSAIFTLTAGEVNPYYDAGLVENTAPIAEVDVYEVHQGQLLNVPSAGVMANDSDPEEDSLTAELVTNVSHGYLTFNHRLENGSAVFDPGAFFYTAYAGYTGDDSFSYRLHDGALYSNTVTVTINVTDEAPVALDDGVYEVHQGQMLNVPGAGVLANDSDSDEDSLTAELVTNVSHGYLTFNHRLENGSAVFDPGAFFYTAYAGYTGEDFFSYRVFDGALYSNTVTVTIDVTDEAPIALDDGVYDVYQGQMLNVPGTGVLANDSDTDQDPLIAELVTNVSHGYLTFNHRLENGSAIYDPGAFFYTAYAGYTGEDAFTYRVYDGALYSNTVTVTINVTDTAPVAQDDGVYEVLSGQLLNVPGAGVLANDSDVEEDALTAELVTNVSHGYLTFNHRLENGSAVYDPGAFFYTAYAGYSGEDSFTYRTYDGALYSEVVTVSLNVLPLATITGIAFGDTDADGTRDETELGWAGIVVRLLDSEGVDVAVAMTDGEGNYSFDNVLPGAYRVAFVPPEGASFTFQDQGDDAFDSDVNAMGISDLFWLLSGQLFNHLDAGIA